MWIKHSNLVFWLYFGILGILIKEGETQQRQHFRTQPQSKEVIEGSTAVVECEVGNQRGRVQWAKDGEILGFNRTIPGNARYHMIGTGGDGVHHLRIANVSLEDDGSYQCQVGPADSHPPLMATASLTVLVPPTSVKLIGRGRQGLIEVNDEEEISLECQVKNAKPVASIKWLKNNREIKIDGRQDRTQESRLDKRFNIVSKIKIKLTSRDDGVNYACQADHPALKTPMKSSVKISVLYPPGPPVITGYTEKEQIRSGEERSLSCRSKGGNPLGRVLWYRNNVLLDSTDRQIDGESSNDYRFIVEPRDNNATFTCEVKSRVLDTPLRTSVKLLVLFPPDMVTVTGPDQAGIGENVTVKCTAENSNPPASLSWTMDGKHFSNARTVNHSSPGGGFDSTSWLSVVVPRVDIDIIFTCHATNDVLGKTEVDSFPLSVLRPPQTPIIEDYTQGMGIPVNKEKFLTCSSKGGNPPAHLQWYRNNQKINSINLVQKDKSTAKLQLKAAPQDNGAHFRCEATNDATSSPLSVATTLAVFYPPENIEINVHPLKLKAGSQASLTCRTGPSNPPAEISWLRGDFKLNGHLQESQATPFKGKNVTSVLLLNLTASDDGLTYSCLALNKPLQVVQKRAITLRVSYPPVFHSPPPEIVDMHVGDSLTLNLTAKANPEPIAYSWTHRGIPLPKAVMGGSIRRGYEFSRYATIEPASMSRVTADGPLLIVHNVSVADAGDYRLEVTNELETTTAEIYLNVQYPAKIVESTSKVYVDIGNEAILQCSLDGNPLKGNMVSWTRYGYDFSRTTNSYNKRKAILKISRAERNDTGFFACNVDNGIGKLASANITLIVRSKPVIISSNLWTEAAARVAATGRLVCQAEGAPEVHFSWTKNRRPLQDSSFDSKFHNETSKTGLVTWVSTLEIRRVTKRDYGHYSCIAANALGRTTFSIHFTAPTRPRPPSSLKVSNTTHDSVTLWWTPGFDGGLTQYFTIRYKKAGDRYKFVDVYEPNVQMFTVNGLQLDSEYYFSIMSKNEIGHSEYMGEFVRAVTLSEAPPTPVPASNVGREKGGTPPLPALWVVIVVLVATALLALNVSAIVCIIRRRRRKRGGGGGMGIGGTHSSKKFILASRGSGGGPPTQSKGGGMQSMSAIPLSGVSASSHQFGSDQSSSKSTANTMYAPSSYNDTVVGETLSSISEKSRESSYNQEDSVGDYEDQTHKHVTSSYLIDQIDPPPEYASQAPSSQPSSANYDPNEDDYADVLRRNAYNNQLGKGTPRPPSRATHYSTSPESRGYISYSYSPSPTNLPNGGAHYHVPCTNPILNLGLQETVRSMAYPLSEAITEDEIMQNLGLNPELPPQLALEQHSIPSDHPSLTLDPHSITIDHPIVSMNELTRNSSELRVQPATLSTFSSHSHPHPHPSPSNLENPELQGHLV